MSNFNEILNINKYTAKGDYKTKRKEHQQRILQYFKERLSKIKKLNKNGYNLEAKILTICMISGLSSIYSTGQTDKEKFNNLVINYSVFPWNKVSTPYLHKLIKKANYTSLCGNCNRKIKEYIKTIYNAYDFKAQTDSLDKDKFPFTIIHDLNETMRENECRCGILDPLLITHLRNSTYAAILYAEYRCVLIHEGKDSDQSWEFPDADRPTYWSVKDEEYPDISINTPTIIKTLEEIISNLYKTEK